MSIVTYENVDTPVFEIDFLRYLFANGESGLLLSYLPGHLYADVDKTVPAVFGGGIASFDDLSGNGVTGPQSVSTARPILGRVPRGGRRNLLTWTEDFSNPAWVKQGVTVAIAGSETPSSGLAHEMRETGTTGSHRIYQLGIPVITGKNYAVGFRIKPVGRTRFRLQAGGSTGTNTVSVDFSDPPAGVIYDGNGWYTVPRSLVSVGTGLADLIINALNDAGEASYAGVDGLLAAYISGPQYDDASAELTPYQRVGSEYDVTEAGVPSVYYARYDSADDVLPQDATLPAISDGTVILIGQQGIWIDEGYSFAGGNWSLGPTTYTDGPAGILGVVGDMLDLVVLDRPLTPQERQKVIRAGVRRGSAGALMPSGADIISLMRPSVNTAPSDWVRYHDGKVYADGAGWQNIIDSSPVYTGITSEIIDGQHMVRVPKFWVKTADTAAGGVIYSISDKPQPGFQVHPAFYSAGEEIDQFWIGAYHASEVDNVFESKPGVLPRVNLSGVTAISRMEARNTGGQSGWGSLTWHQICAVRLLCLIEIGTPDVRTAIGQGWNSTTSNSGSGAELQPTGTSDANWRGIYDLWGNAWQQTTGAELRDGRIWLADVTGALVDTGLNMPATRYIGACVGGDLAWAFLPDSRGPTESSAGYLSYSVVNLTATRAFRYGGSFSTAPAAVGLFSLAGNNSLGSTNVDFGFRLAKV